jgi:lipid-binding SYLF domain-containing protein
MKKLFILALVIGFVVTVSMGPALAGWDAAQVKQETKAAEETMAKFKEKDPAMQKRFFDEAYAYAVFPKIGKGGLILGGSQGTGMVYERKRIVGRATVGSATVGLQAGGQVFSQIIFFQDKAALENMKSNQMKFAANASAVAVKAGASTAVDYEGGVAVFTMGEGGLMLEASIGGQSFKFEPKPK